MSSSGVRGRTSMIYPILGITPGESKQWKLGKDIISYYENRGDLHIIDNIPYIKMRPKDEDNYSYSPFWSHFFEDDIYGTAEKGNLEVKSYFGVKDIFDTVKPVGLLKKIIEHMRGQNMDKHFTVLDFFSGSSTTADAVMRINAEYDLDINYIMVQLPEIIAKEKSAYKAGYKTIDQMGMARIIKSAKKIKKETNADIDYGFKIVRLENPSNKLLDKINEFDSQEKLILDDFVNEFTIGNTRGKDVILTTWLNEDGYGIAKETIKIKLKDYIIDVYENTAYIIDKGFKIEDVIELIRLIEENELSISRVVFYPYSILFNVVHQLKNSLSNLRYNKQVELLERY